MTRTTHSRKTLAELSSRLRGYTTRETTAIAFAQKMGISFCRCDDCGYGCSEDELVVPIPDLGQRLDPGGVVPAGECPKCGALSYPVAIGN